MTESDIYQLIGEAYCNGMAHGMEKSASFEKKALGPSTLSSYLDKVINLGDDSRLMQAIQRVGGRAWGVTKGILKDNLSIPLNSPWHNLMSKANGAHMNIDDIMSVRGAFERGKKLGKIAEGIYERSALKNYLSSLGK